MAKLSNEPERLPRLLPEYKVYRDAEKYTAEIRLPGVQKKDISLEVADRSFSLRALKEDAEYFLCYLFAYEVNEAEAEASYKDGLLKLVVPLKEKPEASQGGS